MKPCSPLLIFTEQGFLEHGVAARAVALTTCIGGHHEG